jgi:hypothetical protein
MKDGINRLAAATVAAALYIISIELSFVCLHDRTSRALAPLALFYVDILLHSPFSFYIILGFFFSCCGWRLLALYGDLYSIDWLPEI